MNKNLGRFKCVLRFGALSLLGATGAAANEVSMSKLSIGVAVYQAQSDLSINESNKRFAGKGMDAEVTAFDGDRTAYEINLGWRWNELTKTTLAYLDLGDVSSSLSIAGGVPLGSVEAVLDEVQPFTADGFYVSQGLFVPLSNNVYLYPEVGAYRWEYESVHIGDVSKKVSHSGTDLLVGLGLHGKFADSFSMGVSVKQILLAKQAVNLWGVSASYHF